MTRLGFWTRVLDDVGAAERYRLAAQQIVAAERNGFDTAWVGQHHFRAAEGGLPSPFVLLAHVAALTARIRLGTAGLSLDLDDPVRVAEDAAVLDLVSGGRVELGVAPCDDPVAGLAFGAGAGGVEHARDRVFAEKLDSLVAALAGGALGADRNRLQPPGRDLLGRIWQRPATTAEGARAARAGHGIMLAPRPPRWSDAGGAGSARVQRAVVDAYLDALPRGIPPRILLVRSVFVVDSRSESRRFGGAAAAASATGDTLLGTVEEVTESLARDQVAARATELAIEAPPSARAHELVLRSIELVAREVAPALGWGGAARGALAG